MSAAPLTKEQLSEWIAALETEAMRGCYDGDEASVFFDACEWLSRSKNKLRPQAQEVPNESV